MLVNADVKSLEVVTCAYLSRDTVLMQEVREGIDFHELNKQRFGLPDRVTAKRFKFKLIYGASAYGYANDGDFTDVSTSQDFWQNVIDEYYQKYAGVGAWHTQLVQGVLQSGSYNSPTGRTYTYPAPDVAARMWFWRPKILNYPVQGLGADLVMLARISSYRRIKASGINAVPVSSVHDSIVYDVDNPKDAWYNISMILKKSVEDVPSNFERMFGVKFDLPLNAEVKTGKTLGDMQIVNFN